MLHRSCHAPIARLHGMPGGSMGVRAQDEVRLNGGQVVQYTISMQHTQIKKQES